MFSLSVLIPNASFLRDFTNDQNFFAFSFFLGLSGSGLSVSKENIFLGITSSFRGVNVSLLKDTTQPQPLAPESETLPLGHHAPQDR